MSEKIKQLAELLATHNKIVFFGGTGTSTASGIPDFRSTTGLYQTESGGAYRPETMLSHTFFHRKTKDFFDFYREKMIYQDAQPNMAHQVLAKLEEMGKLSAIVTQNIDGLHQMAGSQKVFEIHGSIHRNYCEKCKAFYDLAYILSTKDIPKCKDCGGHVKPDVVLYEEALDDQVVSGAIAAIQGADLLIIGGTSLVVYPAASFVRYYKGENLVLMNKGQTTMDCEADLVIRESIDRAFAEAMHILEINN